MFHKSATIKVSSATKKTDDLPAGAKVAIHGTKCRYPGNRTITKQSLLEALKEEEVRNK